MHLIWLSIVLPPMAFVVVNFRQTQRPEIWAYCTWIALAVTTAWVAFGWYRIESQSSILTPQAMLYALVTTNELPIVAMTIGSAMNWVIARIIGKTPPAEPPMTASDSTAASHFPDSQENS